MISPEKLRYCLVRALYVDGVTHCGIRLAA